MTGPINIVDSFTAISLYQVTVTTEDDTPENTPIERQAYMKKLHLEVINGDGDIVGNKGK